MTDFDVMSMTAWEVLADTTTFNKRTRRQIRDQRQDIRSVTGTPRMSNFFTDPAPDPAPEPDPPRRTFSPVHSMDRSGGSGPGSGRSSDRSACSVRSAHSARSVRSAHSARSTQSRGVALSDMALRAKVDKMIQDKLEYNDIISRDMDERLKSMQRGGIDPAPDFDMAQASTRSKELQYWRSKMTMEERELELNVSTFIKIAADLIESVATNMDISIVHTRGLSDKISTALAEGRFAPAIRQFVHTGGGNGLSFMTKNPSLNFLFTFGTIILSNHIGQKSLPQARPISPPARPISPPARPISPPARPISPTPQPSSPPPEAWAAQAFTDFFDDEEPAAKVVANAVEPKEVEPKAVAVEPKVVEPKAVEPKALEPKADANAVEPKVDANAVEPKADANAVEPKADANAVEPKVDANAVESKADANAVESKAPNTFVAISGNTNMNFDPLIKNLSCGVKEYMIISKEKKLIEESKPIIAKVTVI